MALVYDIAIDQGTTWSLVVEWQNPDGSPIVMTGFVCRMQFRKSVHNPVVALELNNTAGGIVLDEAHGTMTLDLTEEETVGLSGVYVHDLLVTSPDDLATRLIEGKVTVRAAVTRPWDGP